MFTDIKIDPQTKEVIIPFTLPADSTVSAILLDKDNNFITSIFSGITYKKGFQTYRWNKRDVVRNPVPAGEYKVQIGFNHFKAEWEGGIGNNSLKTVWPEEYQGLSFTTDIVVAGNYLYQCNDYNEGQPSLHRCLLSTPRVHQFVIASRCTIHRLCTDGVRVYCLTRGRISDDGHGGHVLNEFIFAVNIADNTPVRFSEGSTVTLNNFHDGTYSGINAEVLANDTKGQQIPRKIAFAVQQKGHYLFTAYTANHTIRVNDKETGAFVYDNRISSPRLLCVSGSLLIVYDGSSLRKYSIDLSGHLKPAGSISPSDYKAIKDIKFSADGLALIVVYGDAVQQVKWYNIASGSLQATQGERNAYALSPAVSYNKFLFDDDGAVAIQPDGSYWLLEKPNSRLLQYDAAKKYAGEICWLPATYHIGVERTLGKRVFAGLKEYAVDYTKPLSEPGAWKLTHNYTAFATGYQPSIFDVSVFSNGRTYCFCSNDDYTREVIDITNGFVPTGKKFRIEFRCNLYPDGVYYADHTDVGGMYRHRRYPLTGFSGNIPQFGPSEVLFEKILAPDDPLHRGGPTYVYGERIGTSIITYEENVGLAVDGFHLGLYDPVKNKFIFRTAKGSGRAYYGPFKTDEEFENGSDTNYPGSAALAMGDFILTGHHGEFYKSAQTNVYKLYHKTGLYLGWFGWYPGLYAADDPQRFYGRAGNALSICVVMVQGTWYLYTCDESIHSRVHRWRITGLNTFATQTLSLHLTADATEQALRNKVAGSGELPYQAIYKEGAFGGWQADAPTYNDNDGTGRGQWEIFSNRMDNKQPGFSALFSTHTTGITRSISKAFSIGKQSKWQVSFRFHIEQFSVSYGGTQGKIFLRDTNRRAIAEIDFRLFNDAGSLWFGLFFNNVLLFPKFLQTSRSPMADTIRWLNTCAIQYDKGRLACRYKDFPVVIAPVADAKADATQPGSLSIEFSYLGGYPLGMTIGIYDANIFTDTSGTRLTWFGQKKKITHTVDSYADMMLIEGGGEEKKYVVVGQDESLDLLNTCYRILPDGSRELIISNEI